jgi:ABC-type transport system involved in multi-copper enzyme maturation permease subunit
MTLPQTVFVASSLIRDSFRQSRNSGMTWVLLTFTAICVLLCLSIGFRGDRPTLERRPWEDPAYLPRSESSKTTPEAAAAEGVDLPTGEMTILFGTFRVPITRSRAETVRSIELLLAGGIADTAGVLLALIWTAGFLPSFLDPAATGVLLSKPTPRWLLIVGKFLGVLLLVALQATLFIALTWLALGIRTGVWDSRYFVGVPILLLHFVAFSCISTLLAVITRSTVAGVIGTLAIWFLCWGINYARQAAFVTGGAAPGLEFAYWALPKPADFGVLLIEALHAGDSFGQDSVLESVRQGGAVRPELSILTSLIVPMACFGAAIWRLSRAEQ